MAKRILLADDSITIQKVISITFASEDYILDIVGDGEAAIQKAREVKPDLVMADVAMPGKNGYEVCSLIKNDPSLKNTPVLLLAGTFEPLNKDEAIKTGADDSIIKPFESQELLDKVRELLSKSAGPELAVVPKASAPEVETNSMWEANDFLSLPEEYEEKKEDKDYGADLDFLSSGALFEADEARKELSLPHEGEDFTDLVIQEEELKPIEEDIGGKFEPLSNDHSFDLGGGFDDFKPETDKPAFDLGAFDQKEEPKKPSYDLGAFELVDEPKKSSHEIESFGLKEETKKAEPFEVEPFDLEPFKPEKKEEPIIQAWELPVPEAKLENVEEADQFAEPDLLEIPEDVIEPPPVIPFNRSERTEERKTIPFERPFDAPRPIREVITPVPSASTPQVSEEEVAKAIQRVADRVETRLIEDMNLRLGKTEAEVAAAIERAASRVEERLRNDLGQKLEKVDSQVAKAIENTVQRLEERLKAELGAKLERSLAVPKEQIEEIVSKTSKQVVEHVAWEVLPELAERLIKNEINKVKDALLRTRS